MTRSPESSTLPNLSGAFLIDVEMARERLRGEEHWRANLLRTDVDFVLSTCAPPWISPEDAHDSADVFWLLSFEHGTPPLSAQELESWLYAFVGPHRIPYVQPRLAGFEVVDRDGGSYTTSAHVPFLRRSADCASPTFWASRMNRWHLFREAQDAVDFARVIDDMRLSESPARVLELFTLPFRSPHPLQKHRERVLPPMRAMKVLRRKHGKAAR